MNLTGAKLKVAYVAEDDWGVTPANPEMRLIRGIRSESLGVNREEIPSQEINPWRTDSYTAEGPQDAVGGLDLEFNDSLLDLISKAFGKVVTTQEDPEVELYKHKILITEPSSVTIQKTLDDEVFHILRGMIPNALSFTHEVNSFVGLSMDFVGKKYDRTRVNLDDSIVMPTFKPFDTIRHQILLNGVRLRANSLNLSIANNIDRTYVLGPTDMNAGANKFEATGSFSINVLKGDTTFQDKVDSQALDELRIVYSDKVSLVIPKLKYSGGDLVPKGAGSGLVNIEVPFRALIDLETLETIYFEVISDKPTL